MAEMVITELRRTGSGVEPTLVVFRWSSSTHSSMQNPLSTKLKVLTVRRTPNGSDTPVEQVMGTSWEPFVVEGEWNDKWAGAGFAQAMKREFARLVGRTPLVRLQLDQESLVGLITEFVPTYVTRDRVGYSFVLSPHVNEMVGSFRQSANRVPPQPINQRTDAAHADLVALLEASDVALDIPAKNADVIEARAELEEVSAAVDKATAAALGGPGADAERGLLALASAFRRVRSAVQSTMLSVTRKRSDLSVAFDDAISILKFDEWRTATLRQAVQATGSSRDAERDIRAAAARRPRAIHHALAGESLERISLRYYGTADNWRAIYDANNLASILLDGGEELLIPERTS